MSKLRRLFCLSALLSSSYLAAETVDSSSDLDETDFQALRDWIKSKRQVTVREIGGALSISGEVRTEFQVTEEVSDGVDQRGPASPCGVPNYGYDVQFNIMLDYRTDRTWAAVKLEFDNDAGIVSGTTDRIKLERAYLGARFIDHNTWTFDGEIGRRGMSSAFDSKVQFRSIFDGILLKYDHNFEEIGIAYAHIAAFIINENKDQYGYVGEIGFLDIANTGLYTKYSLIDWDTKHYVDPLRNDRFRFLVSQLILGYEITPQIFNKTLFFFLAGLYNHAAEKLAVSAYKKANWGAYGGFAIGKLKKRGDWAFQATYQLLAAQAVPDFDVAGIGLGNACKTGFYTTKDSLNAPSVATTVSTAGGNTNYRGFKLQWDYLVTNAITLQQIWQQSITLDDAIGPFRHYKQYEMELIYAF